MSVPNRTSAIWSLRIGAGPYVGTVEGDRIRLAFPDGSGMADCIYMTRADARLLAKRINQCLDETRNR